MPLRMFIGVVEPPFIGVIVLFIGVLGFIMGLGLHLVILIVFRARPRENGFRVIFEKLLLEIA